MVRVLDGVARELVEPAFALLLRGEPERQGDGEHAAVDARKRRAPGGERLEAACDVGAVGGAEAGVGEQQREALADVAVATGAGDRADRHALGLAHPLVARALYTSLAPGERALWHARAARLLSSEHADPEEVALHLLHSEPAADPATVAELRAAASRASIRGAPESAAVFLRRALAEPAIDVSVDAAVRGELGLALAAHVQPDAAVLLAEAVERAPSPTQRSELALRGARALAIDGHQHAAIDLCRRGLAQPAAMPPETLERLEAELVTNCFGDAGTVVEGRDRLRHPVADATVLGLWRVNAALQAMLAGRPAEDSLTLLRPVLEHDALAREPDSLLNAIAMFVLIANDELETALRASDAVRQGDQPAARLASREPLVQLARGVELVVRDQDEHRGRVQQRIGLAGEGLLASSGRSIATTSAGRLRGWRPGRR